MTTPVVRIIENGVRNAVIRLTADFDSATDLTNNVPFELSDLGTYPNLGTPTKFAIEQITARTVGVIVTLYWQGTANEIAATFPANYMAQFDHYRTGGIPNNAGGATGRMLLSTLNASAGAKYDITLQVRKVYGNAS